MVEESFPSLAAFLPTYALLPVVIVGYVLVPEGPHTIDNATRFRWHIEPTDGPSNAVQWTAVSDWNDVPPIDFPAMRHRAEGLRPGSPAIDRLTVHGGEPEIYEVTPASRFARELLFDELQALRWVAAGSMKHASDDPLIPPRF